VVLKGICPNGDLNQEKNQRAARSFRKFTMLQRSDFRHYPSSTSGEKLFQLLRHHFLQLPQLFEAFDKIDSITSLNSWSDYVKEFVPLNLCERIISCGVSLLERYGWTTIFNSEFKQHVGDSIFLQTQERNRLYRVSCDAVRASQQSVSKTVAGGIKAWAQKRHPHCYLCGVKMNFETKQENDSYTLDHIWPRRLGGESDEDNLLPACRECNNHHKKSFASWGAIAVQSLVFGLEPNTSLSRMEGSHRFAIYHRDVQGIAIEQGISLKQAYLEVGPSHGVAVYRHSEVAHFFNLYTVTEHF
jgi:hypothetical protein